MSLTLTALAALTREALLEVAHVSPRITTLITDLEGLIATGEAPAAPPAAAAPTSAE